MNHPCTKRITCPGPTPGLEADSPITNYSSEYTDGVNFDGWRFPVINPYDPDVPGWWSADACHGAFHCISYVSQEEADDCAAALAFNCVHTPPSPPTTPDICVINPPACAPVGPELFPNQTQTASFVCPDGSIFTWTISAGTVYSTSPALANAVALAMAQRRVARYFICLPPLPSQPCDGVFYSVSLDIAGNNGPYTVDIIAGDLPPGISPIMVDFNTFGFQGIPSGAGDYVFTVRVTASTGTTVDKTYAMSVMGFVNATILTEAVIGEAYTENLVAAGGTAPHTFAVTDGALPNGLAMDTAGQITGTPTATGNNTLTVSVTDSAGRVCSHEFTLAVTCLIATASLPNGTNGVAYSQTLTVNGFVGSVTWSIIVGALPSGLSLNSSTGEISGTPDTDETQAFTVQALQGEFSCEKALSITIESATPIDWTQLTWTNPQTTGTILIFDPSVNPTTQDNFEVHCTATSPGGGFPDISQGKNSGSLTYNGPLAHCKLTASNVLIAANDGEGCQANWVAWVSGSHFAEFSIGGTIAGDYLFDVPSTLGSNETISVRFEVNAVSFNAAHTRIARVKGVFANQ